MVVIRQLKVLGILGFPIPKYDAQTCTWQPQKTSASGWASATTRLLMVTPALSTFADVNRSW